MIIEIKAPTPGESITEVQIANWLVKTGDYVAKDTEIAEIDSDKATLTVNAEMAGAITILVEAGETVSIGTVIAQINSDAIAPEGMAIESTFKKSEALKPAAEEIKHAETPAALDEVKITPLARKIMEEKQLTGREVLEKLGHARITRQDVLNASMETNSAPQIMDNSVIYESSRETERKKMSTLRIKLAQRLVQVKNETAMLTTFNEVNMGRIMGMKKQYNEKFKEQFGVGIGFMSFFTKAITIALAKFPQVNAMMNGYLQCFSNYWLYT